jgi:hypothetical protein
MTPIEVGGKPYLLVKTPPKRNACGTCAFLRATPCPRTESGVLMCVTFQGSLQGGMFIEDKPEAVAAYIAARLE